MGLAGRGVTCHALRRTFCTLLLRAGVNLRAVGELAGHAKLGTTARYVRLNDAELARVYDRCFPGAGVAARRAACWTAIPNRSEWSPMPSTPT